MLNFSTSPPDLVFTGVNSIAPVGPVLAGFTEDGTLCRLSFAKHQNEKQILRQWQKEWPKTQFIKEEKTVKTLFSSFVMPAKAGIPFVLERNKEKRDSRLRGSDSKDEKKLSPKFHLVGTAFQQKVWKALLDIPMGQTWSYGEMARHIKQPHAARAVGMALARNPVPLFIPCHRVIAADGRLGGFSGGHDKGNLSIKLLLLESEGVHIR